MSVFQGSRYIKTSIYQRKDHAVVFNIRRKSKFNLKDATFYTVVKGDTLDMLAYRFYNNAQLYWAILDANPQYQSEIEVSVGDVIAIPAYNQVVSYLG